MGLWCGPALLAAAASPHALGSRPTATACTPYPIACTMYPVPCTLYHIIYTMYPVPCSPRGPGIETSRHRCAPLLRSNPRLVKLVTRCAPAARGAIPVSPSHINVPLLRSGRCERWSQIFMSATRSLSPETPLDNLSAALAHTEHGAPATRTRTPYAWIWTQM